MPLNSKVGRKMPRREAPPASRKKPHLRRQSSERSVYVNGQKIRALCKARLWTQQQLADKSDVSKRTIESAERDGPIEISTIRVIAQALGVQPEELMDSEETGPQVFGLSRLPLTAEELIGREKELSLLDEAWD